MSVQNECRDTYRRVRCILTKQYLIKKGFDTTLWEYERICHICHLISRVIDMILPLSLRLFRRFLFSVTSLFPQG